MSWAKIDDRANEHRKQLDAGAEACWLWACGLMYANRQPARDGFIPERMIGMLYPFPRPAELARKLVKAGLWRKASGGYLIHEFTIWNRSKEEIEELKQKGRERAAKSYRRRRAKNGKSSGEENAQPEAKADPKDHVSSGSPPLPLPLPIPTATSGSERQPCPRDLMLEPDQRATLETYPIPGWGIDAITVTYVAKYVGNKREMRTIDEWRRGLVTAITATWNDANKRPKKPEAANDGRPAMELPKGVKFGTEGL